MKKLLAIVIVLTGTIGQQATAAKPLFESEEPIQAVLTAPISQVYKQAKQEVRLYHDGSFAFKVGDAEVTKVPVKIRTRGIYRRINCRNPPLHLNFKKKKNDDNLLKGQNKLKLVGPCQNQSSYRSLLGLEYLVYQMFEEVSDYHFKTRVIEMSMVDSDGKNKPKTMTTFVIEDSDDMAERTGMKELDINSVARGDMDLEHTALVEIFQFMISNLDYSLRKARKGEKCCHNARLIANKDGSGKVIPVPYDFDQSGFIDAPYAQPPEQIKVRNVRQRKFTGFCKEERHFRSAVAKFKQRKDRIYGAVSQSDLVSDKVKKRSLAYLDGFYKTLDDESKLQKQILDRCRGELISG